MIPLKDGVSSMSFVDYNAAIQGTGPFAVFAVHVVGATIGRVAVE
jgi:hypothetical protein